MTNSLIDEITKYSVEQKEAFETWNRYLKNSRELEYKIERLLDKTKKEFGINYARVYLRLTSDEKCFNIHNIHLGYNTGCYIQIQGKWVYYKESPGRHIYVHKIDFTKDVKKDSQIDLQKFEAFCSKLTELTGFPVKIEQYEIVSKGDIKIPKDHDDLLTIHTDGAIVAFGKKLYEGWDIGDPWAVVRTRSGSYMVYYATNGHGFGYDHVVAPGESLTDFYTFLGGLTEARKAIPANVMKHLEAGT
jgi:hypothetical protein